MKAAESADFLSAADALFDEGQYEEARRVCAHLLGQAEEISVRAEAAALMARTFLVVGAVEDAVPWLEHAHDTTSPEVPQGYSRYLSVRGRLEWKRGELGKAQSTFQELYEYCGRYGLAARGVDALRMLGIVSAGAEQLEWTRKAVAAAEEAGLSRELASLWNNLGAAYEDLGQLSEALPAYLKARDYHRAYGKALQQLKADWAVAHVQRLLGKLIDARELLNLLLPAFEELDNDEFFGWTCYELALIELVEGNRQQSLDLFLRTRLHLKEARLWETDRTTREKVEAHIASLTTIILP